MLFFGFENIFQVESSSDYTQRCPRSDNGWSFWWNHWYKGKFIVLLLPFFNWLKDGKLSGTVEVSAMGSMLAQFYKKVDPRTTRKLLQSVNEDCDPSPCTGIFQINSCIWTQIWLINWWKIFRWTITWWSSNYFFKWTSRFSSTDLQSSS